MRPRQRVWGVLNLPELNIAMFAFLLHFVWEMLQSGFFRGLAETLHWDAVLVCTRATFGDAGIALAAFWVVAWVGGSGRRWLLRPSIGQIAGFIAVGLMVTVVLEILATKVWDRWMYSAAMPVVPLLEVGLLPLLQWTMLPPLLVWFVHRQLRTGTGETARVDGDGGRYQAHSHGLSEHRIAIPTPPHHQKRGDVDASH